MSRVRGVIQISFLPMSQKNISFGGLLCSVYPAMASMDSDVESDVVDFLTDAGAAEVLHSLSSPRIDGDSESKQHADDREIVLRKLGKLCCSKLKCQRLYTLDDILRSRNHFSRLSQEDRRRLLAPVVKETHPVLNGQTVCVAFVRLYFGCGKKVITNVKRMQTPERKPAERSFVVEARVCDELDRLAYYGEQQPDSKEVHLGFPSRKAAYEWLPEEFRNAVSLSYFRKCWRLRRPHIKLRKVMR